MTYLNELAQSFKNAVAVPGTFADVYPSTTDSDVDDMLADGLAEAQLDGFLSGITLNLGTNSTTPDLSVAQRALVVIYAAARMIVVDIKNRKNHVRYEAGTTVFEQDQTASMLNELLREVSDRKKALIERAERGELDSSGAFVGDLAYMRATGDYGWHSDLGFNAYSDL